MPTPTNPQDLTTGERFLIARLRETAAWRAENCADPYVHHTQSQRRVAEKYGLTLWQYRRLERDDSVVKSDIRTPDVEPLAEHEGLLIRRVRRRMTRRSLAKALGVSDYWLYRMEHGEVNLDKLREYWLAVP